MKALSEAKRVTKKGGLIFVAYLMNDYGVLMYGFKENMIKRVSRRWQADKRFSSVCQKKKICMNMSHYRTLKK